MRWKLFCLGLFLGSILGIAVLTWVQKNTKEIPKNTQKIIFFQEKDTLYLDGIPIEGSLLSKMDYCEAGKFIAKVHKIDDFYLLIYKDLR